MGQFLLKRFLAFFPVALGVLFVVSTLLRFVPGDPVDQLLMGSFATEAEKQELRSQLGLDKSMFMQTWDYIQGVLSGNLGESLTYGEPIVDLILERLGPTIELAVVSLIVAVLISLPLGVTAAKQKGSKWDHICSTTSLLGVAIPNFWLGPMLILLFSVHLNWLPVSDRGGWLSYILPAITMGTALAAVLTRMTRNSILRNMTEDYVRTAKSKGSSAFSIFYKHILRNAALPVVTILGLQFGVLLTGAIITESIFDWPGLGSLMVEALNNRDYPLVQGCVLLFSLTYLIVNLLTDITYGFLDPRIKIDS